MIRTNNKKIVAMYVNGYKILSVYTQGQLIWPEETIILSCYCNGYWIDENPWTDNTSWKDNFD